MPNPQDAWSHARSAYKHPWTAAGVVGLITVPGTVLYTEAARRDVSAAAQWAASVLVGGLTLALVFLARFLFLYWMAPRRQRDAALQQARALESTLQATTATKDAAIQAAQHEAEVARLRLDSPDAALVQRERRERERELRAIITALADSFDRIQEFVEQALPMARDGAWHGQGYAGLGVARHLAGEMPYERLSSFEGLEPLFRAIRTVDLRLRSLAQCGEFSTGVMENVRVPPFDDLASFFERLGEDLSVAQRLVNTAMTDARELRERDDD